MILYFSAFAMKGAPDGGGGVSVTEDAMRKGK